MEYGTPSKIPDGRYFLKVTKNGGKVFHQVNNVKFFTDNIVPSDTSLFSQIDDEILAQAKASKVAWFGKEISDETVTSAYQKSINLAGELPASFATIRGEIVTTCYDTQKNAVDLSSVSAGSPVDVLLELIGLVFTKRTFEPVWKMIQVRVKSQPRFPREYLFSDDPAEDDIDL
jgi:hypothetical protein